MAGYELQTCSVKTTIQPSEPPSLLVGPEVHKDSIIDWGLVKDKLEAW